MAGRLWHLIGHSLTRFRWPLVGLVALVVVLACVLVIPQWLVRWELGDAVRTLTVAERAAAINDVRATLLQAIGGAVILLGAYFTYRQLQTSREQLQIAQQGQVTERFTRAIEQLGHETPDVRLGGIYALERIANDSPEDRSSIAEVLTAFVRGYAPWPPRRPGQADDEESIDDVEPLGVWARDAQAALTVLGRRRPPISPAEALDLSLTDLRRADLRGAKLRKSNLERARLLGADLRGAQLQEANLSQADLLESDLRDADLQGADLFDTVLYNARLQGANLQEANFSTADLEGANLQDARLQGAILYNTRLQKANLRGAHLQGAILDRARLQNAVLDEAQLQGAQCNAKTVWPDGFDWRLGGRCRVSDSSVTG